MALDLYPRIVLHTPGGDAVIDPWAAGSGQPGVVSIAGVNMPYDVVWGEASLPPASAQLSAGGLLGGGAGMLLLIGGALLLLMGGKR